MDFIVMGSRGLSSEENGSHKLKVLGSVARRVSELSECPVSLSRNPQFL